MKPVLLAGTAIVNLALISYTIFFYYERRTLKLSNRVMFFLTTGVALDIISTTCMIIGSSHGPFTLHGIIGYSSLGLMAADAIISWRKRLSGGEGITVPATVHKFTLAAYSWWITAYITGFLLVMLRR